MTHQQDASADQGHLTGYGSKPYRSFVLIALFIAYTLSFIDRNLIGVLAEPIINSFELTDGQFGFLAGWPFAFFYAAMGLPIAMAADRYNRVNIIAVSVILWSLATALCGFAAGFFTLILCRIGVAIGEAGCSPPATSIISDYYPAQHRATALGVYSMGVTTGAVLAYLFGGPIADMQGADFGAWISGIGLGGLFSTIDWNDVEGWRIAFIVIGGPGVIVALLVWRSIKEPPRGYSDDPETVKVEKASIRQTLGELKSNATFWWVTFGAAITAIVGYGLFTFQIPFLVREHGLSVREASLYYGAPIAAFGALGTFLGGWVTDRLRPRWRHAIAGVPAVSFLIAIPAYLFAFYSETRFGVLIGWSTAITFHYTYLSAQYNLTQIVVSPQSRATAVAVLLIVISILGNGVGPQFVGSISEYLTANQLTGTDLTPALCASLDQLSPSQQDMCAEARSSSLKQSLAVTAFWFIAASACFMMAARTLRRNAVVQV